MLWMSCSKPAPPQTLYRTSNWFYLLCPTHRSFVPPTRDEESETQRKAHAKRVRETRRSTQGVTLDEIKSAEQLVKKKNSTNAAEVSIVNANSGRRPRRRSSLPEGPFIVWMIWVFFFFDFYFGFVLIFFSFFFGFVFKILRFWFESPPVGQVRVSTWVGYCRANVELSVCVWNSPK